MWNKLRQFFKRGRVSSGLMRASRAASRGTSAAEVEQRPFLGWIAPQRDSR
jgi:hypothetical protein